MTCPISETAQTRSAQIDHSTQAPFFHGNRLPPKSRQPVSRVERWVLSRLLQAVGQPAVSVVFPNGEEISPVGQTTTSRVILRTRRTLWKLALNPVFQFPESYASGEIEVEGLENLLTSIFQQFNQDQAYGTWSDRLVQLVAASRRGNSRDESRSNIHHHYDVGNEFYKLWLDRRLLYTCAYYEQPSLTLEQAQVAKMDHVCRKLGLQPGMRVIEAGCGWGALALHMARRWGVSVRAFNISVEQIKYARNLARQLEVEDRVEFVQDDWRSISGRCDAFVSVGMLEHVGVKNYHLLGEVIHRCLRKDGVGLIHSIGQNISLPVNPWIERRIFPGAHPPTLGEMMQIFEPNDYSVLDVENLRLHYAKTLSDWLDRFERNSQRIREQFDEQFVRTWRFYLIGSMAAFQAGALQLYQILFAPAASNHIPWTRASFYPAHLDRRRGNGIRRRPGDSGPLTTERANG